jgi:hypothetical protein
MGTGGEQRAMGNGQWARRCVTVGPACLHAFGPVVAKGSPKCPVAIRGCQAKGRHLARVRSLALTHKQRGGCVF